MVAGVSVLALLSAAIAVLLLAVLLGSFVNRPIRASLAAPRVCESGVPEGLPWREVTIPSVRGKKLFGWFLAAGAGARALAIVHGWGATRR